MLFDLGNILVRKVFRKFGFPGFATDNFDSFKIFS